MKERKEDKIDERRDSENIKKNEVTGGAFQVG